MAYHCLSAVIVAFCLDSCSYTEAVRHLSTFTSVDSSRSIADLQTVLNEELKNPEVIKN